MGIIDEILERIDPIDIIGEYVRLERSGKEYRGLCPFHREKTPSFYVNPDTGLYHCFGCGASGNIFRFIMDIEGVDFKEALRILARKAGIELGEPREQKEIFVLTKFAEYLHRILLNTKNPALEYVKSIRKLKDKDIVAFKLGYYPMGALRNFMQKEGVSSAFMVKLGILKEGRNGFYEVFLGRLIFPIFSETGKVIGLGGRILDNSDAPKYINSPDSPWFKKGRHLYGYFQSKRVIREKREAIITEGYMDVIAMHAAGFNYTVASLGTSFTEDHAVLLSKHVDKAYLFFDMDVAGRRAIDRVVPLLFKNGVVPLIVEAGGAKDPAELYERGQVNVIEEALKNAKDFVEYYLSLAKSEDDRVKILRKLKGIIASTKDDVLMGVYLNKVREITGVELRLHKGAKKTKMFSQYLSAEVKMLVAAMEFRELREFIKDRISEDMLEDEEAKDIVRSLKDGREFEEILATIPEGRRKRYVEFLSTLDFRGEAREVLKRDLERKLRNLLLKSKIVKKLSLEEVIKLKKEEMRGHERLDNSE